MITDHEIVLTVGKEPLEDAIGFENEFAWVIDGATSLASTRAAPESVSDATWLVARLDAEIRRRSTSLAPLTDVLAECIGALSEHAAREWVSEPEIPPSAAIALSAVRPDGRLEYAVLADCSVVSQVGRAPFVVTDDRADAGNSAARDLLAELVVTMPFTDALEQVRPLLLERRKTGMNIDAPGGYWVVALDDEAARHALTGVIDISPGQPWWLLSDGLSRCVDLFNLFDWRDFVSSRGFDLGRIRDELIAFEEQDADARAFPRWNISDDKAGARFSWSPDA
jgi:hypothetical protein